KLDTEDDDLLPNANSQEREVYNDLKDKMDRMLASNPDCPGDGNMDGVVDAKDVSEWRRIATDWKLSSVYDFVTGQFRDGETNHLDGTVIQDNLQVTCEPTYSIY